MGMIYMSVRIIFSGTCIHVAVAKIYDRKILVVKYINVCMEIDVS